MTVTRETNWVLGSQNIKQVNTASFIKLIFSREPEQKAEGYKVLGHCIPGCQSYEFDDEFWKVIRIHASDRNFKRTWWSDPCPNIVEGFYGIFWWQQIFSLQWSPSGISCAKTSGWRHLQNCFSSQVNFTLLYFYRKEKLLLLLKGKTFSSQVNFTFTKG